MYRGWGWGGGAKGVNGKLTMNNEFVCALVMR